MKKGCKAWASRQVKVAEVGGGEGRETKECEWNSRCHHDWLRRCHCSRPPHHCHFQGTISVIKGPIRPGFMTNVEKNDPKCQAVSSSLPELWTDFLGYKPNKEFIYTKFV